MMFRLPPDHLRTLGLGMSPIEQAALNAITSPLRSAAEAALAESQRLFGPTSPDHLAGVTGAAAIEAMRITSSLPDPLHNAAEEAMRQARALERFLP